MGGLRRHMPTTYWTFFAATLAIAGIPLFAGFFSKDEILARAFAAGAGDLNGFGTVYTVLWVLGMVAALLTAFYMFRALFMTFRGDYRGGAEKEAPPPRVAAHHDAPADRPRRVVRSSAVLWDSRASSSTSPGST